MTSLKHLLVNCLLFITLNFLLVGCTNLSPWYFNKDVPHVLKGVKSICLYVRPFVVTDYDKSMGYVKTGYSTKNVDLNIEKMINPSKIYSDVKDIIKKSRFSVAHKDYIPPPDDSISYLKMGFLGKPPPSLKECDAAVYVFVYAGPIYVATATFTGRYHYYSAAGSEYKAPVYDYGTDFTGEVCREYWMRLVVKGETVFGSSRSLSENTSLQKIRLLKIEAG